MSDIAFNPVLLQQGLVNAAVYVRDVWTSAVSGNVLPGMRKPVNDDKYAAALNTGSSLQFPAAFEAIVLPYDYIEGADKIEKPQSAFDMKPMLLHGPKSRPRADGMGRYNTIPFRHYTPKPASAGNSAIAIRMRMPDDVYMAAKQLAPSVPGASGKIKWGESLEWEQPFSTISAVTGYTHKSSIYQGMYRTGNPGHHSYVTFRRVSTPRMGKSGKLIGSDPNSWWYPAVAANNITEAVYNYTMPQVEKNIIAIVEKMVH